MRSKAILRLILATLVALGVVLSGISPEGFHHHDDELHCALNHEDQSVDSCHLSVYHHEFSASKSCGHTHHISEFHHHCELKGYYYAHRVLHFFEEAQQAFTATVGATYIAGIEQACAHSISTSKQGRAPPIA